MIIINDTALYIPNCLSTTWAQIGAIYMKDDLLMIVLYEGQAISVPHLSKAETDQIFSAHAKYLEEESKLPTLTEEIGSSIPPIATNSSPFQLGIGSLGGIQNAMQHNPQFSDSPDLPPDILDKVGSFSKMLLPEDPNLIPKAEPHCNCFFCQIARAINDTPKTMNENEENGVADDELQFQQWDIEQTSDQMYTVTNRLDPAEKYNVFLGDPIGCTCGKEGCEHILAVLRS